MSSAALESIQQDDLAMSVARALALANEAASAQGANPDQALITITEEVPPPRRLWRIHYGPRDFLHRRGGDLIILVDETADKIDRILRGQ
jgi:hypothetical protein